MTRVSEVAYLAPIESGSDRPPEGTAGEESSCGDIGEGRHVWIAMLGGGLWQTREGEGGEKGEPGGGEQ